MKFVGVDFESYYDDVVSLRTISPWAYCWHPQTAPYLVAIDSEDIRFVGEPRDFNWASIHGCAWVSHNVSFDGLVYQRLIEDGIIPPGIVPTMWIDTADMAAYHKYPRNLAGCCRELFGVELDKGVRDRAKGKTVEQMKAEGWWDEMIRYGGNDALWCRRVAEKWYPAWPTEERELSRLSREAAWRGVPVDLPGCEKAIEHLQELKTKCERAIPWVGTSPILSHEAAARQAIAEGITEWPASTSKKNPKFIHVCEKYGADHPWILAVRDYRSINAMLSKGQQLYDGARADGWYHYQMLYYGAGKTGRFSAGFKDANTDDDSDDKLNLLNMYKKPMFGVDFRALLKAPEGYVFNVRDYAQIEARALLWKVGDRNFIDVLAREGNLYQAYAKAKGRYSGNDLKADDKELYTHTKVIVLGCGYQCGPDKYRSVAESDYGIVFSPEEAARDVYGYRNDNPRVVQHWAEHMRWLQISARQGDAEHVIELPSGRKLVYFNPRFEMTERNGKKWQEVVVSHVHGTKGKDRMYGGKATENEIQGLSRDVLRDAWVAADREGLPPILWTVYDEAVFLDKIEDAEKNTKEIERVMTTSSSWAKGLPLGVSGAISPVYFKD